MEPLLSVVARILRFIKRALPAAFSTIRQLMLGLIMLRPWIINIVHDPSDVFEV